LEWKINAANKKRVDEMRFPRGTTVNLPAPVTRSMH